MGGSGERCLFSFAEQIEVLLRVLAAIARQPFGGERVGRRVAEAGHFLLDGRCDFAFDVRAGDSCRRRRRRRGPASGGLACRACWSLVLRRGGRPLPRPLPMPLAGLAIALVCAPFMRHACSPWHCSQPAPGSSWQAIASLAICSWSMAASSISSFVGFLLHLRRVAGPFAAWRRRPSGRRLA